MLRLNASVHRWLTEQERKKIDKAIKHQQIETVVSALADNSISQLSELDVTLSKETSTQSIEINGTAIDDEFHKQLKNEVGDMYSMWEEADRRFVFNKIILLNSTS